MKTAGERILLVVVSLLLCAPAAAADERTPDTLWIFDADFEDLLGDNAGWDSEDWSGTIACSNYWHKDTIRIGDFEHLGDSTWWCGTYDDCGVQPRGYGNNWTCILSREFPEVAAASEPGDVLILEYDQRWAIEACYDYGYVDVSVDGGETWDTRAYVTNPGFACSQPGPSQDWDAPGSWGMYGHQVLSMSEFAGDTLTLRFRFESDVVYSSQDTPNNPPIYNSCLDGAWQIDNIEWSVNGGTVWLDDCESPGSNGWSTENTPSSGQAGVVYERRYEEFDGREGWMMAAYDTATGAMVDSQRSRLYSPPIRIAGVPDHAIAVYEGWADLPDGGVLDDFVGIGKYASDSYECARRHIPGLTYFPKSLYNDGPYWTTVTDTIPSTEEEWVTLVVRALGRDDATQHGVGFVIDRVRVGVPIQTGVDDGGAGAAWVMPPRPSPFGDETTVRYGLATRGRVSLKVYDLAGRVVRTLVDADREAGPHTVSWNGTTDAGTRAASGVYFVKMELEGTATGPGEVRKLVLLK